MAFDLKINKSKNHDFPKTRQEWASWVNELHDDAVRERRAQEFQWAVNFAYYLGHQHLHFSPITGTLHRDLDNEEIIVNRIAPFVEVRMSKLTRNKPILMVVPNKDERDTREAAKLSELLTKHLWKSMKMDSKIRTLSLFMNICGSGFLKSLWNPGIGDKIKVPREGQEEFLALTEDGEEDLDEIFLGDIETHIKSPFSILASPGATSVDDASWIIDRSHMTVRQLKETFPHVDIDELELGSEMTDFEAFVNRLQSPIFSTMVGIDQSRLEKGQKRKENNVVLVKEFWMKPNKIYPEGLVATVVGQTLIDLQSFPNNIIEYPFIKVDEKEQPFSFYGQATVTRMIPLQRRYNQARTQVAKNAAIMANGKYLVPKGSGIHEDAFTDEEGEIIEYNPTFPRPEQIRISPLPNYIVESQIQDVTDLRDVSGEREAGNIPGAPQVTAGIALETAAEIADVIVQPIVRNLQEGLIALGRHWLMLANEHYEDPRTLRIIGEDNRVLIQEFDKTDLKHQTDVSIQIESFLGNSKAAQQQKLLDMWDRRIITDPNSFLRAFMSGDIDLVRAEQESFDNVIAEDIERIKNGEQPPVQPFDNHVLYVKRLSEFIQSPEFRRMPEDRQTLAMETLQAHLQMIQPLQQEAPNPAAVGTPFGSQVPDGTTGA